MRIKRIKSIKLNGSVSGSSTKIDKTPKIKTNTKRDVGDPTYDLIRVFEQRDIGEMSDTELETRIENLQKMRMMRFTTSKKKTALDLILSQITVEKAREILALNTTSINEDKS
jgi:hypothetical protein